MARCPNGRRLDGVGALHRSLRHGSRPLGAAGRQARLKLAERWVDGGEKGLALEAEIHLHYLRRQTDSPDIAARAQYAWARLLTRNGLLADALEAYRPLARDYPTVTLHDGKTGRRLARRPDRRQTVRPLPRRSVGGLGPPALSKLKKSRRGILRMRPYWPASRGTGSFRLVAGIYALVSTLNPSHSWWPAPIGRPSRGPCRCRRRAPISASASFKADTLPAIRRRTIFWSWRWARLSSALIASNAASAGCAAFCPPTRPPTPYFNRAARTAASTGREPRTASQFNALACSAPPARTASTCKLRKASRRLTLRRETCVGCEPTRRRCSKHSATKIISIWRNLISTATPAPSRRPHRRRRGGNDSRLPRLL